MTRDVAIYAPLAAPLYERGGGSSGGGEQQMAMLARSLGGSGLRAAHIVYPVTDPVAPPGVDLVGRPPFRGHEPRVGKLVEARAIWSAMHRADARVYVFRTGGVELAFAAAFCRVRRRRLVFSTSAVVDFTFEGVRSNRRDRGLYRFGARSADAIVVQTEEQLELATRAFGSVSAVERIPSFAEMPEATRLAGEAFVWIGRLAPYKRPLEFVRLAAALPEARFRMIGVEPTDDPRAYEEVTAAAAELSNLELLGRLPRAQTGEEMRRAHAVVSTSSTEGMPNVFLEAWARGVPVLSLAVDPDGVIERERLGAVAGDSLEGLADAARRLAAPAERDAAGDRAREYVRREHSAEGVAARWLSLLAPLAGRAEAG